MQNGSETYPDMSWIPKELLEAVQSSGAFEDCKTFVDMPLRRHTCVEAATKDVLHALPGGAEAVREAVHHHFDQAGSDLDQPTSLSSHPQSPAAFPSGSVRGIWSQWLAGSWTKLLRTCPTVESEANNTASLLPVPHPMVIPAGRFRESYYWDSYWCALALDACGLHAEGTGALRNLLWTIRTYGVVPNGMRKYYLGRSQPPLLAAALEKMPHAREQDTIQLLVEEHKSATIGCKAVRVELEGGEIVVLHRYWSNTAEPRPESFREDIELAQELVESDKRRLWRNMSSACASGWDFSARWMESGFDLKSTCTTRVIPVDLNAFLFKMERAIATIAEEGGDPSTASTFLQLAEQRRYAIANVLWSDVHKRWQDLIMSEEDYDSSLLGQCVPKQNLDCVDGVFASDFVPLWCEAETSSEQARQALESLRRSGLLMEGGVVASNKNSGQQWDYPNVWPPLVHMLVEGVAKHIDPDDPCSLDKQMATAFLRNAWHGWQSTGNMYEKYDGRKVCGTAGSGGEYEVQVGFGWTNAVVLLLLRDGYGRELDEPGTSSTA